MIRPLTVNLKFFSRFFFLAIPLFIAGLILAPDYASGQTGVEPQVVEKINKSWEAYRNNKHQRAINLLRPVLDRNRLPPNVSLLAGKIYYEQNRFSKSIRQFETTLRSLNESVKRQNVQHYLQRAKKLDRLNLVNRQFSHFEILSAPSLPGNLPVNLNHDLEKARRRIGGDLNLFPDKPLTVIFYTRPQFRRVIKAPVWSGGVFDGKIHLPYNDNSDEPYTTRTLYHEYAHALLHQITRDNLPLWFNEGFATYQEYRQSREAFRYQQINNNPPERKLRKLEDISSMFKSESDREDARLAYEYSYSLLKFLEERFGLPVIKRIINTTGETSSFEKAIERETGRSLGSLRFAWENWIDGEVR